MTIAPAVPPVPCGDRPVPAPAPAHAVPFLAWLLLMWAGDRLPMSAAGAYALRSVLVLGLLLVLRPWRWHERLEARHLPVSLGVGVAVFAVWVLPEAFGDSAPGDFYARWLVRPLGRAPSASSGARFAPAECGWLLAACRVLGSALVIAVAEEYFWRGFLYRWLISRDFLDVALGTRDREATIWATALFAAEHHRFAVAVLAGLAYLELMRRTRDLHAAVVAHATTNLLLGIYVLATRSYQFW